MWRISFHRSEVHALSSRFEPERSNAANKKETGLNAPCARRGSALEVDGPSCYPADMKRRRRRRDSPGHRKRDACEARTSSSRKAGRRLLVLLIGGVVAGIAVVIRPGFTT